MVYGNAGPGVYRRRGGLPEFLNQEGVTADIRCGDPPRPGLREIHLPVRLPYTNCIAGWIGRRSMHA
jgi:hypothetical protein